MILWCVITGLVRGLLWLFYWLYIILNGDLTGLHYRDEIVEACVHLFAGSVGQDFVLLDGNNRPHRACAVNEYIKCERNRIYGLVCPLPWCYSNRACMGHTSTTDQCSAESTTDPGGARTSAHLGVGKNSSSCNQETHSQIQFYVKSCFWR